MTTVKSHGIKFEIPESWSYFKISPRTWHDGHQGVNFHVASMAVPIDDDSVYASGTMPLLGPLDMAFVLQEMLPDRVIRPGEGYWDASKPSALARDQFRPERLHVTLPGQLGYLSPFTASHRAFSFYAVLGSEAASSRLPVLNSILSSMSVAGDRD
jgi:hypothetical protein